jgi:catechol 2,3-dioxygenase-like lactoylglutathione lyase family enzyme
VKVVAAPFRLGRGRRAEPTGRAIYSPLVSVCVRLEQAGLRVRDFQRSIRFYTGALGLRLVRRGDTRSWGGGRWALLQDPKSRRVIELNWYPKGSLFYGPYRPGDALDHLDFTIGVASRQALERTYRRLLRHGASPTRWSPSTTEGWMASVRDPNGVWITIGRRPTRAERRASG